MPEREPSFSGIFYIASIFDLGVVFPDLRVYIMPEVGVCHVSNMVQVPC